MLQNWIASCDNTFSLKQGETRTRSVPIPHPLTCTFTNCEYLWKSWHWCIALLFLFTLIFHLMLYGLHSTTKSFDPTHPVLYDIHKNQITMILMSWKLKRRVAHSLLYDSVHSRRTMFILCYILWLMVMTIKMVIKMVKWTKIMLVMISRLWVPLLIRYCMNMEHDCLLYSLMWESRY